MKSALKGRFFSSLPAVSYTCTNTTERKEKNSGETAATSHLLCRLHRWRHRRGWTGGRETRRCGSMRREAQKKKQEKKVEAVHWKGQRMIQVRGGEGRMPKQLERFRI